MGFLPQDVSYGMSEDLFGRTVVPRFERTIDKPIPLLGIKIGDCHGQVIGDQANLVTALAQRLFGLLAFGEVPLEVPFPRIEVTDQNGRGPVDRSKAETDGADAEQRDQPTAVQVKLPHDGHGVGPGHEPRDGMHDQEVGQVKQGDQREAPENREKSEWRASRRPSSPAPEEPGSGIADDPQDQDVDNRHEGNRLPYHELVLAGRHRIGSAF